MCPPARLSSLCLETNNALFPKVCWVLLHSAYFQTPIRYVRQDRKATCIISDNFTVFDCAIRVASIIYDIVCWLRKLFPDLKHTSVTGPNHFLITIFPARERWKHICQVTYKFDRIVMDTSRSWQPVFRRSYSSLVSGSGHWSWGFPHCGNESISFGSLLN